MKRVGLVVAYDGTNYSGWQIQPNGITIQGVLNDALTDLLGEKIEIMGASRTDAGVHALGNVAVFDTNTRIPGEKISYALNHRLPEDIRIQLSEEVEPDFHPRYCDSEKTYEYRILNRKFPVPTERLYSYFYHYKLDVDKMREAAKKAKAAVKKAFQYQLDGKGFSFVEFVSNCPTNWGMSPLESLDHVHNVVMKEFPLGEFRAK